jgi:YhcH/YjgK/YiaL family protein
MIVDKIENAGQYASVLPDMARVLELLSNSRLLHQPDGKYLFAENRIRYLVQRYATKPAEACKLESHERFIDIQLVVRGEELVGHSFRDSLQIAAPYDSEGDKTYYVHKVPGEMNLIRLSAGHFAIFFPQDAHMPCVQGDASCDVHKIVVKVPSGS